MKGRSSFFLFAILIAVGCAPESRETPTKGNLHVLIAESAAPSIIAEVDEFLRLYRQGGANITYSVLPSEHVISRFVNDTVRMMFCTRSIRPDESSRMGKASGSVIEVRVAYDGVVAVVSAKNPLDQLTLQEIRKILSHAVSRWGQLPYARAPSGSVRVYLQDSSDISEYLMNRLMKGERIPAGFIRASSSVEVLEKVAGDPQGVGFVGLSWIDSARTSVKALSLAASSEDADTTFKPPPDAPGKAFSPHPAYIYLNDYPMKRAVFMYIRSSEGDLATGFSTFVATQEGQRIFLNRGLLPGTQHIQLNRPR